MEKMLMRLLQVTALCTMLFLASLAIGFCQSGETNRSMTTDEVIARLESKYGGADIHAKFIQESSLEAMDITDTATGQVWFKHPGMMRWEYKTPDAHAIITDGQMLWIHRPSDNQVIVGDALTYFGNGKGASFLANIGLIKEEFRVEKVAAQKSGHYTLKLIPRQEKLDLSKIFLNIDQKTFIIDSVSTKNAYGDETLIKFQNIEFKTAIEASKFLCEIPSDADVVQLEQ